MDPTVVWESDAACLVKTANAKVAKYSCLESQIKEQFEVKEVRIFMLLIRARGGWTPGNDQALRALRGMWCAPSQATNLKPEI